MMVAIDLHLSLSQENLVKLEQFKEKRLKMAKVVYDEDTIQLLENATTEVLIGYFLSSKLY